MVRQTAFLAVGGAPQPEAVLRVAVRGSHGRECRRVRGEDRLGDVRLGGRVLESVREVQRTDLAVPGHVPQQPAVRVEGDGQVHGPAVRVQPGIAEQDGRGRGPAVGPHLQLGFGDLYGERAVRAEGRHRIRAELAYGGACGHVPQGGGAAGSGVDQALAVRAEGQALALRTGDRGVRGLPAQFGRPPGGRRVQLNGPARRAVGVGRAVLGQGDGAVPRCAQHRLAGTAVDEDHLVGSGGTDRDPGGLPGDREDLGRRAVRHEQRAGLAGLEVDQPDPVAHGLRGDGPRGVHGGRQVGGARGQVGPARALAADHVPDLHARLGVEYGQGPAVEQEVRVVVVVTGRDPGEVVGDAPLVLAQRSVQGGPRVVDRGDPPGRDAQQGGHFGVRGTQALGDGGHRTGGRLAGPFVADALLLPGDQARHERERQQGRRGRAQPPGTPLARCGRLAARLQERALQPARAVPVRRPGHAGACRLRGVAGREVLGPPALPVPVPGGRGEPAQQEQRFAVAVHPVAQPRPGAQQAEGGEACGVVLQDEEPGDGEGFERVAQRAAFLVRATVEPFRRGGGAEGVLGAVGGGAGDDQAERDLPYGLPDRFG